MLITPAVPPPLPFEVPPTAKVSILIPFKDQLALLRNCLRSLRRGSYRRLEIVLLDNGSTAPEMARYLRRVQQRRGFRVVRCPGPFNFAHICNRGAAAARGDYLLFLNNDVEVQSPDWLERMLAVAADPRIGVVGAALLYPDGTVQHAGIEPNDDGEWEHVDRGVPVELLKGDIRAVSAVTGACLLMRRDRFLELGGFDERFPVAYNDVDLCCRARRRGWLVALVPQARLVHFESLSRGYSVPPRA
ncbi:MAG: glycosyltransferase family 2 protein [Dehalococcoidia bacterium]|nr:glycosyltransferase family 2 protein [Dehalococcoidia bacterium]